MNNSFVSKDVAVEVAVVFAKAPSFRTDPESNSTGHLWYWTVSINTNNYLLFNARGKYQRNYERSKKEKEYCYLYHVVVPSFVNLCIGHIL